LARNEDQNRPTKFPTTAFSDKSHSNSKKVKTKKNKMMGWIENGGEVIDKAGGGSGGGGSGGVGGGGGGRR